VLPVTTLTTLVTKNTAIKAKSLAPATRVCYQSQISPSP
jgi:hypothetical protein